MNRNFEDAQYYLKRAAETAAKGVREELEPLQTRFREMVDRDGEPEASRIDSLREDLASLEKRAEGEAREAIAEARGKLQAYRNRNN